MSDVQPNPYAPPHAEVRDVGPDSRPVHRPKEVRRAVALLWISLPLGLGSNLLDRSLAQAASLPAAWIGISVGFGLVALLVVFVSFGRNWARIALLIMFLLGLVGWLVSLDDFGASPVADSLGAMDLALQAFAFYYIFTRPGSVWFGHRGR